MDIWVGYPTVVGKEQSSWHGTTGIMPLILKGTESSAWANSCITGLLTKTLKLPSDHRNERWW